MRPTFLRRLPALLLLPLAASVALAAPAAATKPAPLQPGLIATYSAGDRTITNVALSPNFTLAANESVHPQLATDFRLTYEGTLRLIEAGDYSLSSAGEPATLTLDGQPATSLHLNPGDHALRVEYARPSNAPARLQLLWSSNRFAVEPIPPGVLGHTTAPPAAASQSTLADRGRLLAQELNCTACHQADAPSLTPRAAPDLSKAGARLSAAWIEKWIENPRHFRSGASMPAVLTKPEDRHDVATYLATLDGEPPSTQPATAAASQPAEPPPSPDLVRAGQSLFESVGCVNCHSKTSGRELDGQASKWQSAAALADYLLDPHATDPSGRMPNMLLSKEDAAALAAFLRTATPPTGKAADNARYLITAHLPDYESPFAPGDASRGKSLFASAGCANCHAIPGVAPDPARPTTPAFSKANPTAGCLAPQPPAAAPNYSLTPDDRTALAAFISSIAKFPELSRAPTFQYQQHIQQFSCVACHVADGHTPEVTLDGVPPLSIAGQKLRPDWIRSVIADKQRVRPWLKLRMPHFGKPAEPLVKELASVSGSGPLEPDPEPSPDTVRDGRRLVGKGAGSLSCITCHSYGNQPVTAPEQSRGPELTLMSQRLRADWFRRWVREPQRIIPNTVMPSFFVGKTPAEADPTIDTIWKYFSLGRRMPVPEGGAQSDRVLFLVSATDAPVVQRCFLDHGPAPYDAIPRAIVVGFPNGVAFAFDPESCQLAYAWTTDSPARAFLDMSRGWNGRGDSHGKPVGKTFYTAPSPSLYIESPERKSAPHYKGYTLAKDHVELTYTLDDVQITEHLSPTPNGLLRTLNLSPTNKPLFLRIPQDPTLSITSTTPLAPDPSSTTKVSSTRLSATTPLTLTLAPKEPK